MVVIEFLLGLAGATLLLLFGVSLVQTGIERAFGSSFRRLVTGSNAKLKATFVGMALAASMQSSLAVVILVTGFVGAGVLPFQLALPAAIGADLGSALIIKFLSLDLNWLIPLLLALGGTLFLKSKSLTPRQIGRALLGIALLLLALELIRTTVMPVRDSSFLPHITEVLTRDFLTAFIIGAVLTFFMHSSLAAILMIVTMVSIEAFPLMVGISLMLGANLGSSLLPLWITRGMLPLARRIPVTNFVLRGGAAFIILVVVNRTPIIELLPNIDDAQKVILGHVLFNGLLLLAVPFSNQFAQLAERLLPQDLAGLTETPILYRSVINQDAVNDIKVASASIRREIQRMLQLTEEMMLPVIDLFKKYDKDSMEKIIKKDLIINEALNGIRRYVSELSSVNIIPSDKSEQRKDLRNLLEFAIEIEAAGDVISKTLSKLAANKHQEGIKFSKEGLNELSSMHEKIIANISLAGNVLVSDDIGIARRLLEEKNEFTIRQRKSRKNHLERLARGRVEALESSDLHLETGLAFKEFNSHIASIAYPILAREGKLLNSRLISEN
ncbi:MAG: Na/Pi cotransporter family protein [Flavobacteriaceae bacterium]